MKNMSEKRKDNKGRILQTGEYFDVQNERYIFRKMVDGQRLSITAPDLMSLREQKNELLCKLDKGQMVSKKSKMSLDEYFDFWYDNYAKSGRKATTCTNYQSYYNSYIRGGIGKKQISKVTKLDCQSVINKMITQGLSHSTMANLKSCLNKVFECALDEDIISKNVVRNIQLPRTEKKQKRAMEENQIEIFMEYVKNSKQYSFCYPAFVVLLNSGIRIGELCSLTWDDIDFKDDTITINTSLNRYRKKEYGFTLGVASTKSTTSNRVIKMNRVVKSTLIKHKWQSEQCVSVLPYLDDAGVVRGEVSGFVFMNKSNRVWCEPTFNDLIKRIIESYNKEHPTETIAGFCPHETRHTYTSLAYNAGVDIKAVSSVLGHASTAVTADVYAHLSAKKQKEQDAIIQKICIS